MMIRQYTLDSWEDFEIQIKRLNDFLCDRDKAEFSIPTQLRFRGHADSSWRLQSTLERFTQKRDFESYLHEILGIYIKNEPKLQLPITSAPLDVHSLMGSFFGATESTPISIESPQRTSWLMWMAWLRHHGYPSPLLDWSLSCEVAAYFAFSGATGNQGYVSIFVGLLDAGRGSVGSSTGLTYEFPLNDYFAHYRHKNQQAIYTLSLNKVTRPNATVFEVISPEQVAQLAWENSFHSNGIFAFPYQDLAPMDRPPMDNLIWRFDIPKTERKKVIELLNSRGINEQYLMGKSEDSFVKDLIISQSL